VERKRRMDAVDLDLTEGPKTWGDGFDAVSEGGWKNCPLIGRKKPSGSTECAIEGGTSGKMRETKKGLRREPRPHAERGGKVE